MYSNVKQSEQESFWRIYGERSLYCFHLISVALFLARSRLAGNVLTTTTTSVNFHQTAFHVTMHIVGGEYIALMFDIIF